MKEKCSIRTISPDFRRSTDSKKEAGDPRGSRHQVLFRRSVARFLRMGKLPDVSGQCWSIPPRQVQRSKLSKRTPFGLCTHRVLLPLFLFAITKAPSRLMHSFGDFIKVRSDVSRPEKRLLLERTVRFLTSLCPRGTIFGNSETVVQKIVKVPIPIRRAIYFGHGVPLFATFSHSNCR